MWLSSFQNLDYPLRSLSVGNLIQPETLLRDLALLLLTPLYMLLFLINRICDSAYRLVEHPFPPDLVPLVLPPNRLPVLLLTRVRLLHLTPLPLYPHPSLRVRIAHLLGGFTLLVLYWPLPRALVRIPPRLRRMTIRTTLPTDPRLISFMVHVDHTLL